MALFRLSPRALTRCRFALSPLAETVGTVLQHQRSGGPSDFLRWRDASELRRGLLDLSSRTKYLPDVLSIAPPHGMRTSIEDELPFVAAFGPAELDETFRRAAAASWGPRPDLGWVPSASGPAIAALLDEAWRLFVRPTWPRRRAIGSRDVAYRADLLARDGWQGVIATIARNTGWAGEDTISFGRAEFPDRIVEDGIIFAPHTVGDGTWSCEQPPIYALTYPARGVAAGVDRAAGASLAKLVGAGRARVLVELRTPATSTELARILGVSLGTVSAHLAALRSAGVVDGVRNGRQVRYHLQQRGVELLGAFLLS